MDELTIKEQSASPTSCEQEEDLSEESKLETPISAGADSLHKPKSSAVWYPAFDSTVPPASTFGSLLVAHKEADKSTIRALQTNLSFYPESNPPLWFTTLSPDHTLDACRIRRILRELQDATSWASWLTLAPISEEDISNCVATIEGPFGTPYEGGVFHIHVFFPTRYPFDPPKLRFLTPVYHPNIDLNGDICMDCLKNMWSPVLQVTRVLAGVVLLLDVPEWDDVLVPEVRECWSRSKLEFVEKAKSCTELWARPDLKRPGKEEVDLSSLVGMGLNV